MKHIFDKKKLVPFFWISICCVNLSYAKELIVENVEFLGLHSLPLSTAKHYMSMNPPFILTTQKSASIIKHLYDSSLFSNIKLSSFGHNLLVQLIERPVFSKIEINGNSVLSKDKLLSMLHEANIEEGRVYNPAVLAKIKTIILEQYLSLGYYKAKISVIITPVTSNSIALNLSIYEGEIAKINKIDIIGNTAFSKKTLLKQLDLSTPGLFTFFTHTDRYYEAKLTSSVEQLTNFYLDHGYLQAKVSVTDTKINQDNNLVFLQFSVKEGKPYYMSSYHITGQNIIDNKVLAKVVTLKPGDLCSRQAILDNEKAITGVFGKEGYLFVNVNIIPKFSENSNKVELEFKINPGERTYINHVSFLSNHKTNDSALRRQMSQFESAPASITLLEESKHRLSLLPFMKNVQMDIKPVPGKDSLVDVIYKVEEDSSAQASLTASYSMTDRFGIGLGLHQNNLFGTGNVLGINFNQTSYEKYYYLAYSDPYYTMSGMSRDWNVYVSRVNPAGANLTDSYTSNDYGASVTYGIPVTSDTNAVQRLYFGLGYENTLLNLTNHPSEQVNNFISAHGRHFQQAHVRGGFTSDSRDKVIFPNEGNFTKVFADWYIPVAARSLNYYQLSYEHKTYYPLKHGFIATTHATLAYGNGISSINDYPIFKHYYAGGFESVHGYVGNTLGPQDSNNSPFGGNMLTIGSVGMIFPNFVSDSLRTSLFVDAGNVFSQNDNKKFGGSSAGSGPLRYTVGVEADWFSPMGVAIGFSYAKPITYHPGDQEQRFQFSLGANLG